MLVCKTLVMEALVCKTRVVKVLANKTLVARRLFVRQSESKILYINTPWRLSLRHLLLVALIDKTLVVGGACL